ncbi:MAG: formate dehydrogenase accessory sulfurtransferase FdhD [Lachnospiraceae bacterium]|nr:formate dehydrogenase accessory sulfurtransferase FdhD [Lachnospiraceae bacterium]
MDEHKPIRKHGISAVLDDGRQQNDEKFLIKEHALSIIVNGNRTIKLICTDEYLDELVIGRLLTEGFIKKREDIVKIELSNDRTGVFAEIHEYNAGNMEDMAFIDPCNAYSAESVRLNKLPKIRWKKEWIFALAEEFEKGMPLHNMTKSVHSSILMSDGKVIFACEDIGRHNAVDKAVGYTIKHGIDRSSCILFSSGRIPVDMARKSIAAKIPVLVSKSYPTDDAVGLAHKFGLTLIGNARPEIFNVY